MTRRLRLTVTTSAAVLVAIALTVFSQWWAPHPACRDQQLMWRLLERHDFDGASDVVSRGASLDCADSDGNTLVILAVQVDDVEVLDWLLAHGADPNRPQMVHGVAASNPLMHAIVLGRESHVAALLQHGANPADRIGNGWSAVLETFKVCPERGLVDAVLSHADGIGARDDTGRTVLHVAACPELIAYACERKADPNAQDVNGETPLHDAIFGKVECVAALLECGADPEVRNHDGLTPLQKLERFRKRIPTGHREDHYQQVAQLLSTS